MFSSKLLRSCFNNFLSEQHSESFRFLTIKDNKYWKINDILNFKCYWDQIQYKVKWTRLNWDDEWYYVNKEEFKSLKEVLVEFHKLYSDKQWKFAFHFVLFMQTWIFKEESNVTSILRLNKIEVLINLQCTLVSTLCND